MFPARPEGETMSEAAMETTDMAKKDEKYDASNIQVL